MVWDGESEYMRMSTKVVAINMGQVLAPKTLSNVYIHELSLFLWVTKT